MSDERTLKKNSYLFNGIPFLYLVIEAYLYVLYNLQAFDMVSFLTVKLKTIYLFQEGNIIESRLLALLLIFVSSVGTQPKKKLDINIAKHIITPIIIGLLIFVGSLYFYFYETNFDSYSVSNFTVWYLITTFVGAVLINLGADNISKVIRIGFMKDKFNYDNESFEQPKIPSKGEYSLTLPMTYYHNKKVKHGYFNLTNPFRGTLVMGTPESGKTFSIITPFTKNFIRKQFTTITYDFKYPALTQIVQYEHQRLKKNSKDYKHSFYVINLSDVRYSHRANPLAKRYMKGLPEATETAEALVQSLQKTAAATGSGSERFFTQSAINFLASLFYFLSIFENGKYSTLPHALAFLNRSYDEIFNVLMSVPELENNMTTFRDAHKNKTYGQLDGQIGTLRVSLGPLATPELFWVLSEDGFDLRISSNETPAHLIIANTPRTQSTNSTSNALILNRLTQLINSPGNKPCAVIVDELPTIHFHKIQNLISTARQNKVAVILGVQELPQLVEAYTKTISDTITSVIGNVIAGQARKKETLEWLQQLFGQVKQTKTGVSITKQQTTTSINEHMGFLVPASKIADQKTGEIVAALAPGFSTKEHDFKNTSKYNCTIKIDLEQIKHEEAQYTPHQQIYNFKDEEHVQKILSENSFKIKTEIEYIVQQFPAKKMPKNKIA